MQFLESICFRDGSYRLLQYHQDRIGRTFSNFFPNNAPHQLSELLPQLNFSEKHKIRVIYDSNSVTIENSKYSIRKVNSLKLVEANHVDYSYKFSNREPINQLVNQTKESDIIMVKSGYITDSSYANLAFWDGSHWHTPDRPLLSGVKRQYLIQTGVLNVSSIEVNDLKKFEKLCFINSMMDLGELSLPISSITS